MYIAIHVAIQYIAMSNMKCVLVKHEMKTKGENYQKYVEIRREFEGESR